MGIDISPFVIERNLQLRRDYNFFSGDFFDFIKKTKHTAGMVLYLDVLIHEHDFIRYDSFVEQLVKATEKTAIISAYELPPRQEFSSEITAYHEPISNTLARHGIKTVKIIGEYRDTVIIRFDKGFLYDEVITKQKLFEGEPL